MQLSDSDQMVTGCDERYNERGLTHDESVGDDEKGLVSLGKNNHNTQYDKVLDDEKQMNFYHTNEDDKHQNDISNNNINNNLQNKQKQQYQPQILIKQQHSPQIKTKKQLININDKNIITIGQQHQVEQKNLSKQFQGQQQQINQERQEQKQLQEKLIEIVVVGDDDRNQGNQLIQQAKLQGSMVIAGKQKQQQFLNTNTKTFSTQPQTITQFHPTYKSSTTTLNLQLNQAQQSKYYFQNQKLILTQPITSINSNITFRIDNLKYCVGLGVGLKQVVQKHNYDYMSTTTNQLGHGLYIVTTQGYSWSHSQMDEDDVFRGQEWKNLYTGANILVNLQGQILTFKFKKSTFILTLPSRIRQKYTLCFCVYLHEKTDAVSILS